MRDNMEESIISLALYIIENRATVRAAANRCEILAEYLINNGATVRRAAGHFGISKSTVHKDVSKRLKTINYPLYTQVKEVLEQNKAERHIRGGMATRRKYKGI